MTASVQTSVPSSWRSIAGRSLCASGRNGKVGQSCISSLRRMNVKLVRPSASARWRSRSVFDAISDMRSGGMRVARVAAASGWVVISLTTGAAAQLGVADRRLKTATGADIEGNTLELLNASEAGFKSPVAERILEIMPGRSHQRSCFSTLLGQRLVPQGLTRPRRVPRCGALPVWLSWSGDCPWPAPLLAVAQTYGLPACWSADRSSHQLMARNLIHPAWQGCAKTTMRRCPRNRPRRLLRRGRIRRRGRGHGGPVGRIGSISSRDAGPATDDHRSADPCHDREPADPADKIRYAVAFEMPQRFLISWVSPAHRHRRRSHWLVVRTGINVHPLNSCFAMGRCQGHLAGRSAASDSSRVTRGRVKGSRSQIGLESAFGPDRRP